MQHFTMTVVGLMTIAGSAAECVGEEIRLRAVRVETLADGIDSGTGGLAIDANGSLFTADFGWRLDGRGKGGDKVFRVTPDGKVSLFCREMRGASGNAIDAKGNLYQSSIGGNFISRVTPEGEVSVLSREGFKSPVGIAIDAKGNLYVNNCGAGSIQKVSPDGTSTVFCKSPLLKCPNGITLAADGNFYVANFANGDVVRVSPQGQASKLVTLPGNNNGHLTFHKGMLYVVARTANQVYQVSLDGTAVPFVGSGKRGKTDGEPLKSSLSLPNDLGFSPDGRFLYINETSPIEGDHRILGPTRVRRVAVVGSEDSQAAAPKASLSDLAWIRGHWRGKALGGEFEETWNPPLGDSIMGMFKHVKDGKVNFYEILTIVPDGDSLTLRLKHFHGNLVGWEEKDKSVEFPLKSISADEARFDGLVFSRLGPNRMDISVETSGGKLLFECHRVRDGK